MSLALVPAVFARALEERGYHTLTPVQEAVLAGDAQARDLLVSAQTGSGKTVAYGLAMAAAILDGETLPRATAPLALIIAPTRELALQVETELQWLYASTGARIAACVGGMDPIRERRQLERGCHIVVGTPGRLRDHLERGALDLSGLAAAVLDEADEMLDLGFQDDLKAILDRAPAERRTFLFSATLPRPIIALARDYQTEAFRVEVAGDSGGHADIEYRAIKVAHAKVDRAVVNLLRAYDPSCALVFCATRLAVQRLGEALAGRGFAAVALSGEMSQSERNRALTALREGRAKVCVATDVAARGLDVPQLSLVVHADLPNDAEVLQHRSGRTGRAGNKGVSVLLVPPSRRRRAEMMLQQAGVQYTWEMPPSASIIYAKDRERLLESPLLGEPGDGEDRALADALLKRYAAHQIAVALTRLYRERLPAPEDLEEFVEAPRHARDDRRDTGGAPAREPRRDGRREERRRDDRTDHRREARPEGRREERPRDATRPNNADRHGLAEGVAWFRISVGRERNADPKWLLPEICRQGDVTKKDIGAIRIYDRETRFELDVRLADEFAAKIAARQKGGVVITPANGGEPDFQPATDAILPSEERPVRARHERREARPDAFAKPRGGKPGYKSGAAKKHGKPDGKPDDKTGAKPEGKPGAKKHARFGDVAADAERRQKRKERKKEKRKLKALAKG